MLELNKIYCGDCLNCMKDIDSDSVDCIVTDPPYQLSSPNTKNATKGFMGKSWDICPSVEIWQECLRVLKPGAFAFVMCIPRQDCLARMICRLEDAGFNISFSSVLHTFASGFPKAQNLSKTADTRNGRSSEQYKALGQYLRKKRGNRAQKEISKFFPSKTGGLTGCVANWELGLNVPTKEQWEILKRELDLDNYFDELIEREEAKREITGYERNYSLNATTYLLNHSNELEYEEKRKPATSQAKALDGAYSGMQLKPAVEIVIVAMRPLEEKTYIDQALKNGHGCTWLDDARIPFRYGENPETVTKKPSILKKNAISYMRQDEPLYGGTGHQKGRFPANVLCEDDVLNDGKVINASARPNTEGKEYQSLQPINFYGKKTTVSGYPGNGSFSRYFSLAAWFAERIKQLPKEAQKTFPWLIVPKASKSEKNRGLEKGLYVCECFVVYDEKCKEKNIIHEEKLVKLQGDMDTLHLKDIEEYGTQISIDSEWSTLLFGKTIMELFPKDIASIIKIRTRSTIISQILKWLTSLLTKEYIQDVKLLMGTGGNLASAVKDCSTLIITINEKLASRLIAKDVVSNLQFKISIKEEKERNTHVSVKPLKLMSWLITLASREGDIVLDPFCGSGTTAIAAKMLGRQYIGIEKEEEYCEIARKRLVAIPQRLDSYNVL